jgi:hypothetical protein
VEFLMPKVVVHAGYHGAVKTSKYLDLEVGLN